MDFKKISAMMSILFVVLIAFQNCSDFKPENKVQASTIHFPESACGIEGFEVIYTNYLKPNCSACHSGSFADPPFVTDDLNASYLTTKFMDGVALKESFENNPFCGPDCDLLPGSPMYSFFEEWLTCR